MRLIPRRVLRLARRIPFTLTLTASILVTTAVTGTLIHPITAGQLEAWGFGGVHPTPGGLLRAPLQIFRPYMALSLIPMVLVFVGVCEWRLRTLRTVLIYAIAHVVGYVGCEALLRGLAREGMETARLLIPVRDVGASNGAMGTLGAVLVFMPRAARRLGLALVSIYLGLSFLGQAHIWDFSHVIAFASGITMGAVLYWRRERRWPGLQRDLHVDRIERRRIVAWITLAIGFVDVLTPFAVPDHPGFARIADIMPVGDPQWPRHLLLALGATLIIVAPALGRGRRSAWIVSLLLVSISTVVQWRAGEPGVEHVLSVVLLAALVIWRREFRAPGDPPSVRAGARALLASAAVLVVYTALGFFTLRERFVPPFTVASACQETVSRLLFAPEVKHSFHYASARWFLASIPLVGWGGFGVAMAWLLRGAIAPARSVADSARARSILEKHGQSGTSYMTLWPGNSVFFAADSYMAYRVNDHTAVVLGDPVGPADRARDAVAAFAAFADAHGWNPVFFSATHARRPAYEALEFRTLQIGEDAVVPLAGLEFRGKEWQDVRTALNRASRDGIRFQMLGGGGIPPDLRRQMDEIEGEWMGAKGLPRIGFTLGRIEDVDDPDVEVAIATGPDGVVHAFADWLPIYARNAWVIDLMRRRRSAMPGAMEFLIASSLLTLKDRGYDAAGLGVAPLADIDRDEDAPVLLRVLGRIYERADTYYHFKSLFAFKSKFKPSWEPVYLAHRDLAGVPGTTMAILRAYIPGLDAPMMARFLGDALARKAARD